MKPTQHRPVSRWREEWHDNGAELVAYDCVKCQCGLVFVVRQSGSCLDEEAFGAADEIQEARGHWRAFYREVDDKAGWRTAPLDLSRGFRRDVNKTGPWPTFPLRMAPVLNGLVFKTPRHRAA